MAGKVVLITGCSEGGIGFHLCQEFSKAGATVIATARNLSKMAALDDSFHKLALDVTSDESVNSAVKEAMSIAGKIDILINNAGVECCGPALEIPFETTMSTFETNTFGPVRMIQAIVPHMIERKSGLLINVSSIVARLQPAFSAPYNASKCALSSYTDALDMELRPFNVRVMLLSTGMVRSRIADNYEAAMPALSPESPYSSYTEAIKGRLQLSQDVCMDTKVLTKKVVKEALKSNPTRYLKLGGNSATTNVMEQLPRGLRLWLVWKTSTDWTALRGALFKFMAFFD